MATRLTGQVIQHLRKAVLLRDGGGLTDGHVLGCFIDQRDEAAFAAILQRHGPMVWGVCRRLLPHHDAEDAFQATFLVLVRKAASVLPREMVANWLYGVAHQVALHSRRTTARRRSRERQVTPMPEPGVAEQEPGHDLLPLLDRQLARLPDKYRVAIVLCDLEGKTRKEAARQLGCPEGTVAGRLARARVMLAKRLTHRGVALSGGALAAVLSQHVGAAGVPSSVVSSTIKAASLLAAGQATGVVAAKVAALTEGVVQTMFTTRIKSVLAVVLVVGLVLGGVGAGVGLSTQPAALAQQPGAKADEGKKNDDKPTLTGLQKKQDGKAGKEKQKMLTPEEAIKQMPKENVTVQFKVASVEWDLTHLYSGYPGSAYTHLKDGGKFSASLICNQFSIRWDPDQLKKLGIETHEDFKGKMLRVTGRVEHFGDTFVMWVRDLKNIEVVKE